MLTEVGLQGKHRPSETSAAKGQIIQSQLPHLSSMEPAIESKMPYPAVRERQERSSVAVSILGPGEQDWERRGWGAPKYTLLLTLI